MLRKGVLTSARYGKQVGNRSLAVDYMHDGQQAFIVPQGGEKLCREGDPFSEAGSFRAPP